MGIPCTLNGDGTITLTDDVVVPLPCCEMVVPKGYRSDGQSAPRGLWWITGAPLGGKYDKAWLGHDVLCENAKTTAGRNHADACLLWWLEQMGAGFFKRWGTYLACLTYGRIKFFRRSGW